MPDYGLPGVPRQLSLAEAERVEEVLRLFGELTLWRNNFASQWEEVAELILPSSRNTFFYGNFNFQGQKKTEQQVDSSGMAANNRFAAICDSLLTPRNMFWHGLGPKLIANNQQLMKSRRVRLWFELVTRALFSWRYAPEANFQGQNHANYIGMGAFGTMGMMIDQFDAPYGPKQGIRYRSVPLGELFITENHQGLIDGFIRWFRLTARQAYKMWGAERFPENLRPALEAGSETYFNFLHHVCLSSEYDPKRIDYRSMPWSSCYVSIEGKCLMQEGGYRTFPMAIGRYVQTPGEVYGRSPAMMVLPALKTLNAQKRTFLKQGHRAADPVLLTADDGLVDGVALRPGSLNKGGVTGDGKPLVHILPTGNIQINKEMMEEERSIINDEFLVSLFQILEETPQMTATEVIERTNEKGILLAPTVGRQQSEYLGPMIDREIDILARQRLLPPMPPELIEAKGEYEVVYTSPLSRAMRAQEAAGFMRAIESALTIVNATQDPSVLDAFDFDTAMRGIAEIQSVPESWMADIKAIQAKRKSRAAAQQQDQQIKAMPAQAAMMKAQAATQPNGGQYGGVAQPAPPPQQTPGSVQGAAA